MYGYSRVFGVEHKICFWFLRRSYFVVGPSLRIEKRMINKMDFNWPHTNLLKLWIIIIAQHSSTVKICLARWWWGRGIAWNSLYQNAKNIFNSKLSTHIIRTTLSKVNKINYTIHASFKTHSLSHLFNKIKRKRQTKIVHP